MRSSVVSRGNGGGEPGGAGTVARNVPSEAGVVMPNSVIRAMNAARSSLPLTPGCNSSTDAVQRGLGDGHLQS